MCFMLNVLYSTPFPASALYPTVDYRFCSAAVLALSTLPPVSRYLTSPILAPPSPPWTTISTWNNTSLARCSIHCHHLNTRCHQAHHQARHQWRRSSARRTQYIATMPSSDGIVTSSESRCNPLFSSSPLSLVLSYLFPHLLPSPPILPLDLLHVMATSRSIQPHQLISLEAQD